MRVKLINSTFVAVFRIVQEKYNKKQWLQWSTKILNGGKELLPPSINEPVHFISCINFKKLLMSEKKMYSYFFYILYSKVSKLNKSCLDYLRFFF